MRNNAYEAKIHKALLIKKQNPTINKQIYANGASFLLSVYVCMFIKSLCFFECEVIFTVIA